MVLCPLMMGQGDECMGSPDGQGNLRLGGIIKAHCWETMGSNNSHCCATMCLKDGFHG
jgi:hypothetical protein